MLAFPFPESVLCPCHHPAALFRCLGKYSGKGTTPVEPDAFPVLPHWMHCKSPQCLEVMLFPGTCRASSFLPVNRKRCFQFTCFQFTLRGRLMRGKGEKKILNEFITALLGTASRAKPVRIWPKDDARWDTWQARLRNYKDLLYTKIIPMLNEQSCCHRVTAFKSIFHHDLQVPFLAQIPSQQTAQRFTGLSLTLWWQPDAQVV